MAKYNKNGEEIPDQTPIELPVHFKVPPTIQDQIKRLVGDSEVRRALQEKHIETFEEADDFEVEDDEGKMSSPYEENFDHLHSITRKQEIESGFVSDIPEPKKQWARDVIRKAQNEINKRAARAAAKKAKDEAAEDAAAGEAGK